MASNTDGSRRDVSFALAALLAASLVRADDRPVGPPAPSGPPATEPSPARETLLPARWSLEVAYASVLDTNIDHAADARRDYGVVFMGGAAWQNHASRPSLAFRYEAAIHQYLDSPQWDRISQRADGVFEKKLAKRWTTETTAEVSLKGSSEDRELSNQYSILEQLDYRIVRALELRLFGLARLKRYPAPDEGRDATNTYAGAALRSRLGRARFEIGSRYENNDARDPVRDYKRWVHAAEMAFAGRRDLLDLGVKLYDQHYPFRIVDEGPAEDELREDLRVVAAASWQHRFRDELGLEVAYRYERRTSNEPDKGFNAHQVGVSFLYHFDRPLSRPPESTPAR
jgi:hypothetical protein